MKTWTKAVLGCGGVGCAGLIWMVVLVATSDTVSDLEKLGRAEREARKAAGTSRSPPPVPPAQPEPDAPVAAPPETEPAPPAADARPEPPPFARESDGSPMQLTQHVLSIQLGMRRPESLVGKVVHDLGVNWTARTNIERQEGGRYGVYRNDFEPRTEIAIKLGRKLALPGSQLPAGCYRYLGLIEARTVAGNPVPLMLYRWERFDHRVCMQYDAMTEQ